jgi:branched-chain amino acid transport system permease protein
MNKENYVIAAVIIFGLTAPFLFPNYMVQISLLWIMVLFALTWDTLGGQMGYNSLGNITFFGVGMYISAIVQVGMVYDVALYASPDGAALTGNFAPAQYFTGLGLGILAAAIGNVILAVLLSQIFFGLRGPYFAIGTLGLALAAGELIGAWDYVGGSGGIALPVLPDNAEILLLFSLSCCGIFNLCVPQVAIQNPLWSRHQRHSR